MSGRSNDDADLARYQRQIVLGSLGLQAQRALISGRVLVVGVGGLGTHAAELLARAGVGFLRLVDDDEVDLTNIHRQALYDESDARASLDKAKAAAMHIKQINSNITVEPVASRLDKDNAEALAEGTDVILDGTDNFATRYLINDVSVKTNRPWVFAGVVGTEAQTMTIVPGRTPCLRCVLESPPPPCSDPRCRSVGVLGPAVAAVASYQASEVMKILTGRLDEISPYLLKFDVWTNTLQRIDITNAPEAEDCPCCKGNEFEFLEP